MSDPTDQTYLRRQYQDTSNLDARAELHRRFSINPQDWQRWVFDQFRLPPECHILELGCGPGWLWHNNIDRLPQGWQITLSDLSPGMVDDAQQRLDNSGCDFGFAIIDAQSIPFADERFDAVVANHMLYHVSDRPKALTEIRRVLRSGGHFYASTIGRNHLRGIAQLVSRFDGNIGQLWDAQYTAVPFSLQSAPDELKQYFTGVTLRVYDDALHVTEVEPLVAYVCSTGVAEQSDLDGERRAAFTAFVAREVESQGGLIEIAKESGIFVAKKGQG